MTRLRPCGLAAGLALGLALGVTVSGGCRTTPAPPPPALDAIDRVAEAEPLAREPAVESSADEAETQPGDAAATDATHDATPAPAASDPTSRRIADLEAAIERDHLRLEQLVTTPRDASSPPLHENATLREIAERLTARTRELAALREGSTRAAGPH